MRIGILTTPPYTNYGNILQAYALQTILERMGHKVEIFHPNRKLRKLSWKVRPFVYAKRAIRKYLLRRKNVRIFEENWWDTVASPTTEQFTWKFINDNLHLRRIDNLKNIHPDDYDAIVVGSDQIWRPCYFNVNFKSSITGAYLGFTKGWELRRIAYAPSFGTEEWEYSENETEQCAELLKLFDAVSVREKSAVEICREKFGVEATFVLDPTLLLSAADYIDLFEKSHTPKSCGNLLCYILDDTMEKTHLVELISQAKQLTSFKVNVSPITRYGIPEEHIHPSVEQWIRGFYDAEYVVTDSFHACVFSIIFRKQFTVYGNERLGMARIHSLLSLFGLENRLIYNSGQYQELPPIDYNAVTMRLREMQKISMDFLRSALSCQY